MTSVIRMYSPTGRAAIVNNSSSHIFPPSLLRCLGGRTLRILWFLHRVPFLLLPPLSWDSNPPRILPQAITNQQYLHLKTLQTNLFRIIPGRQGNHQLCLKITAMGKCHKPYPLIITVFPWQQQQDYPHQDLHRHQCSLPNRQAKVFPGKSAKSYLGPRFRILLDPQFMDRPGLHVEVIVCHH